MVRKRTDAPHDLADLLARLRSDARMSREQLAEASGVSIGPIKRIETEGHIPKAQTLLLIARGLATYAPGRRDDDLANEHHYKLMQAAGYIGVTPSVPPKPPTETYPVDELTDDEVTAELERRIGNREVAVSLLAAATNWKHLDPRSQRVILENVRFAAGDDDSDTTRSDQRTRR